LESREVVDELLSRPEVIEMLLRMTDEDMDNLIELMIRAAEKRDIISETMAMSKDYARAIIG
jgi:hypothetical protein